MPDYSYLEALTDAELEALRVETAALSATCTAEVEDLEDAVEAAELAEDAAEQGYQDSLNDAVTEPTVTGETSVKTGGTGPDVVEFIGVDIPVACVVSTGNGDDGIGIITSWDVPEELRVNINLLAFVSGEKVSSEAQILEVDYIGSIPDFNDTILVSDEGVIIPDFFDPEAERNPDQTFFVETGPASTDQIFTVRVFAAVPDQIFSVDALAPPPDQIFNVESIDVLNVSAAEPPFIVEVGPEVPNQIFDVTSSAEPADQTFVVTRGPAVPTEIFPISVINEFIVRASFAVPDKIFYVQLGPPPAATPDQIFGVSVGGPDAPPIPDPDQIFNVYTSFAQPDRTFDVSIVTAHVVDVLEPPFIVEVGPEVPDQTFEVITSAIPYDQLFSVEVGPEVPDQIFEASVITEFEVAAYGAKKTYTIQEADNSGWDYVVSGEGLTFAVEPTINLEVGQSAWLFVNTPANALWIKETQEDGAGDLDPYWADITNQGTTNQRMDVQFWQAGTYYYQSEFNDEAHGQIVVTGTSAAAPDQIFEVLVGADPTGFDQLFDITVGPEFPDQTFVVDIQNDAPPAHQVYETIVGPELPTDSFEVLTGAAPLSYSVTNSGASAYLFTGEGLTSASNPSLTVEVGQMLEFSLNAAGHPLYVSDTNSTGTKDALTTYFHNIIGQGASTGATRVIFSQPGTYHYNCGFHGSMNGTITVTGTGMDQKVYAVAEGVDEYSLSGEGLLNVGNPSISMALGETLYLSVVANNQPLYIKRVAGTGIEVSNPDYMELLVNQGSTNALMKMRFLLPGTYFYASSVDHKFGGTITVTA